MRILADHDELAEVARLLADGATTAQELAAVARRRVQAVAMPAPTLQAVAPIMDAVTRTLVTASEMFTAESGGLQRRASCCVSEEAGGSGRLSTLAADNWVTPPPSAADVALGFAPSTADALVDAILHWQATGGSAPDNGLTVIAGSPIAAFDQLLQGPPPGAQQTISGSGYFPEIGAILENDGPLIDLGAGETARAEWALDNALTNADRMHAITPGIPRGQPDSRPSGLPLEYPGLTQNPIIWAAFPSTAGLSLPIVAPDLSPPG